MRRSKSWSDTKTAILIDLWRQGKTGREISEALDKAGYIATREAVLGRANRLGLSRQPGKNRPTVRKVEVKIVIPEVPGGKKFADLEYNECHFPFSAAQDRWCSEPVEGHPRYCAHHKAVCEGTYQGKVGVSKKQAYGPTPEEQ